MSKEITQEELNQAVLDFAEQRNIRLDDLIVKFTGLRYDAETGEDIQVLAQRLAYDIDQDCWTTSRGTRMDRMRGRIQIINDKMNFY